MTNNQWYNPLPTAPEVFGAAYASPVTTTRDRFPEPAPLLSYAELLRIGVESLRGVMEEPEQSYEAMVGAVLDGLHEAAALSWGPDQQPWVQAVKPAEGEPWAWQEGAA